MTKIILINSCCECPYKRWEGALDNCRSSYDRYECKHSFKELASEFEIIVSPASFDHITQTITPERSKIVWSADGKTEWLGTIPDWCTLKDAPAERPCSDYLFKPHRDYATECHEEELRQSKDGEL